MDARHRDKVAFIRVCSGRFEKGMKVRVARTGMPETVIKCLSYCYLTWVSVLSKVLQLLVRLPSRGLKQAVFIVASACMLTEMQA